MYNVVIKRLTLLAAFLNGVLMMWAYGVFWGCAGFGMIKWAPLLLGLVMLNYPLLIISYNLRRERVARIGRGLALLVFAGTVIGTGWAWWFHENGVWQPWAGLAEEPVAEAELVYYEEGWRVARELSAVETEQARELTAGLWVQNPCVGDWDEVEIPEDMPAVSGEATEAVVFRLADGGEEYFYVTYPYYNQAHLAADLAKCREAEEFINGLSDKYFPKDLAVE